MPALCQHTLIEFSGCPAARLKHSRSVMRILTAAVRHGGGTIVESVAHNFNPFGVSGVVVITESHVTIHTWPELGYAAVDIFSCSKKLDHDAIRLRLKKELGAQRVARKLFHRGPQMPGRRPRPPATRRRKQR